MKKFQALGSNYTFSWAMRQLVTIGTETASKSLISTLEQRYGGHAYLYSQGRNALSQAVRLSRDSNASYVAINSLTCSVVVDAITAADAHPLYIDIDSSKTAHFSAEALEIALLKRNNVAAIVVQNTYGHMVDIASIEALAKKYDCILIEDLAHSIGQKYADGREAGTVGDLVMLSFGRDKLLDVVNGGALIIRSPQLHMAMQPPQETPSLLTQFRDRIYPLLSWKVRATYNIGLGKFILVGMYKLGLAIRSSDGGIARNERLPHWQAALVNLRLEQLDALNAHRREIMAMYEQAFGNKLLSTGGTIRAAFAINRPADALAELREAGFELSDTWYDTPIGPERKYKLLEYPTTECVNAVELSPHIVNLPTHDCIQPEDAKRIIAIVEKYV